MAKGNAPEQPALSLQSGKVQGKKRLQLVTLGGMQERGILGALLVLCVALSFLSPYFLTSSNLLNIARQITVYGIIAVGMTFALVVGEVDLSVGSIYGWCQVVMGLLAVKYGLNIWLAVAVGLAMGAVVGLINGSLSVGFKIPAIIITLGTMNLWRGLTLVITGGWPVNGLPVRSPFFYWFGSGMIGRVFPAPILLLIVTVVIGHILLTRTTFGLKILAIGGNERAAKTAGISIAREKTTTLAALGFLCGLAAAVGMGIMESAEPNAGRGYELDVIAAVIIGGTKITGGQGSVLGSLLGAVLMGVLRNGLVLLGISAFWQIAFTGVILVAAVVIQKMIER